MYRQPTRVASTGSAPPEPLTTPYFLEENVLTAEVVHARPSVPGAALTGRTAPSGTTHGSQHVNDAACTHSSDSAGAKLEPSLCRGGGEDFTRHSNFTSTFSVTCTQRTEFQMNLGQYSYKPRGGEQVNPCVEGRGLSRRAGAT